MNEKSNIKIKLLLLVIVITIFFCSLVFGDPPSPHNIQGKVFQSGGTNGVENGIPVRINNSNLSISKDTQVYAPPIPSLKGSYSTTIDGNDNNDIWAWSWNNSYYGESYAKLASTTTFINIIMNLLRPSEPKISINYPYNNSIIQIGGFFNISTTLKIIGGQNGNNCYIKINYTNENILDYYYDNYIHDLEDINLGISKTSYFNLSPEKEGYINITAEGYCNSDGINFERLGKKTLYNLYIEDNFPPQITPYLPSNFDWLNEQNINFTFYVEDHMDIANCSLYIDNSKKITKIQINNKENNFINYSNINEGNHTWFVSCIDNSSNLNQKNSTKQYFANDYSFPIIKLLSPQDNAVLENNTVNFNYTVSDDYGKLDNCSLYIDDSVVDTNFDPELENQMNFLRYFDAGPYKWYVECYDKAGNQNFSTTKYFNVTDPDLSINSSSIIFETNNPVERTNLEINATIRNIGDEDAENVIVRFYLNYPYESQIGGDEIINVTKGKSVTVTKNWFTKVGSYDIYVSVDPPVETNGSISEINESNNQAYKNLFIPAYQLFYGKIMTDFRLSKKEMTNLFFWLNTSQHQGNIYVSDSDSDINWSSLKSVGKDISGQTSYGDFELIDSKLNMTNLTDSINNSYLKDGSIKNNISISVYSKNISDIPVVNSTNTSKFQTGILWDSSDTSSQNYNGSQDLVFITRIYRNQVGKYGKYDYEIKIPATLKSYIKPNIINKVTFYMEVI